MGKYSFMGFDPIAVFKAKDDIVEIRDRGSWKKIETEDSITEFQAFQDKYTMMHEGPFPFSGGLAGFFSYDLCHKIEKLPASARDDKNLPDIFFGVYDGIFVYDHQKNEAYVTACGLQEKPGKIISRLESCLSDLANAGKVSRESKNRGYFRENYSREEYLEKVRQIRRYIKSGEIYQVNLTRRFETFFSEDPWLLYQRLREINPAPFSSYFDFGDFQIVSSSQERFIKTEKKRIQTRPIKGTIARGKDDDEDRKNREILQNSIKDQSELLMIVDLARNDLGRISETGSVKVEELFSLEEYPTVYHLVAAISGVLKEGVKTKDILKAAFPGGSITGTPKIRAMEIIDELEPTRRNIYTGSIGYIDFNGDLDLNIAIRTIIIKDGRAFFQSGGAIVWDSDEEQEFAEILVKAKALQKALEGF